MELFVQKSDGEGTVGRAAAHSCLHGNPLGQRDVNFRKTVLCSNHPVGFHHQVLFRISLNRVTVYMKGKPPGLLYFDTVVEIDGIENRFQVVITIAPLVDNIESEVHLGAYLNFHNQYVF